MALINTCGGDGCLKMVHDKNLGDGQVSRRKESGIRARTAHLSTDGDTIIGMLKKRSMFHISYVRVRNWNELSKDLGERFWVWEIRAQVNIHMKFGSNYVGEHRWCGTSFFFKHVNCNAEDRFFSSACQLYTLCDKQRSWTEHNHWTEPGIGARTAHLSTEGGTILNIVRTSRQKEKLNWA